MRDDGSGNGQDPRRKAPPQKPAAAGPGSSTGTARPGASGGPRPPAPSPRTAAGSALPRSPAGAARTATASSNPRSPAVAAPLTATGSALPRSPAGAAPRTATASSSPRSPAAAPQRTTSAVSTPRAPVTGPPGTFSAVSTPRVPVTAQPRTSSAVSTPRVPITAPPRTASATSLPRAPNPNPISRKLLAVQLGGVENAQQAQKELLQSAFAADDEPTHFDALLGARAVSGPPVGEEEQTPSAFSFDGTQAPPELTRRDLFKAISPPVQSREGKRQKEVYRLVLDQFAVGTNPRYEPDGPGRPRAHVFVWDVTRAMGAEIPHFLGARELTLAQTVDWLRHEGPMKGWRRADEMAAWQAANEGLPVVAVPRDIKVRLLAMVRPGDFNDDGKPPLSAAALERGNGLNVKQAFGVFAVEFFVHA